MFSGKKDGSKTGSNMIQSIELMNKSDLKWPLVQLCGPQEIIMAFMVRVLGNTVLSVRLIRIYIPVRKQFIIFEHLL